MGKIKATNNYGQFGKHRYLFCQGSLTDNLNKIWIHIYYQEVFSMISEVSSNNRIVKNSWKESTFLLGGVRASTEINSETLSTGVFSFFWGCKITTVKENKYGDQRLLGVLPLFNNGIMPWLDKCTLLNNKVSLKTK